MTKHRCIHQSCSPIKLFFVLIHWIELSVENGGLGQIRYFVLMTWEAPLSLCSSGCLNILRFRKVGEALTYKKRFSISSQLLIDFFLFFLFAWIFSKAVHIYWLSNLWCMHVPPHSERLARPQPPEFSPRTCILMPALRLCWLRIPTFFLAIFSCSAVYFVSSEGIRECLRWG